MAYLESEPPRRPWTKTAFLILFPSLILGLLIFVITRENESPEADYYKNHMSVEEHEYAVPSRFLKTDGTYRRTLFGHKYKLEGSITNTASTAVYKDAVIEISFYSRTNTIINTTSITIYDVFPPGLAKNFNVKVEAPKATDTINWQIVDATRN